MAFGAACSFFFCCEGSVTTNLEEFRNYYRSLSDEALLAFDREELVDAARECYDQELASRGLSRETGAGEPSASSASESGPSFEAVCSFSSFHEAGLALSLLQSAGIPATLEDENTRRAGGMLSNEAAGLRLLVPTEFLDEALEILDADISEADLIAQAEAAGKTDEEED
jgi:hypothetical protein